MELQFRSQRLKKAFESEKQAIRNWGPDVGKKYVTTVHFLGNVESMDDLRSFAFLRFHGLRGNRAGQFAVSLTGKWRLILKAGDDDGAIVVVWGVEDYHD